MHMIRIRTGEHGVDDAADAEHYAQCEEKEISLFHGDFPFCRFIQLSFFCQRSSCMECAGAKHPDLLYIEMFIPPAV